MRDPNADAAEVRLNRLLNLILETAVDGLNFDAATISARHADGVSTVGATDQRFVGLDEAQYEAGEGPCVTMLDPGDPIYLENASQADDRWQHFAETAAHLGVHGSLSIHVPTDSEEVAASLNLYARRRLDLDDAAIRRAATYAEQLAATVESVDAYRSTARLAKDMAEAMRSRAVIEQAKGILMSDERITDEQAFARLIQLSQHANIKVRDVARRLVEERSRPDR